MPIVFPLPWKMEVMEVACQGVCLFFIASGTGVDILTSSLKLLLSKYNHKKKTTVKPLMHFSCHCGEAQLSLNST